jgi:acyl-CoA thioester hydrolase
MSSSFLLSPFELTLRIQAEDIDHMGHASNIVYVRWVQEIAIAHWEAKAPAEVQETLLWVVARHEIDYKAPGMEGDEITLRTWIGGSKGLQFERHTRIWRQSDEQVLSVARTLWIPINAHTRRPQRLSPELRAMFTAPNAEMGEIERPRV